MYTSLTSVQVNLARKLQTWVEHFSEILVDPHERIRYEQYRIYVALHSSLFPSIIRLDISSMLVVAVFLRVVIFLFSYVFHMSFGWFSGGLSAIWAGSALCDFMLIKEGKVGNFVSTGFGSASTRIQRSFQNFEPWGEGRGQTCVTISCRWQWNSPVGRRLRDSCLPSPLPSWVKILKWPLALCQSRPVRPWSDSWIGHEVRNLWPLNWWNQSNRHCKCWKLIRELESERKIDVVRTGREFQRLK